MPSISCACAVLLGLGLSGQSGQSGPSGPSGQPRQEGFGGEPSDVLHPEVRVAPEGNASEGNAYEANVAEATGSPERRAIRRRIAQDRVRTRFLRREEASILGGFRRIEAELKAKQRHQLKLIEEAKAFEARVDAAGRELAGLDAKLAELKDAVGRRLLAMHRLSKTKIGRLVDQISGRHGTSRRRADWLRLVLAYDRRLFDDARTTRAEAERSRATLAEAQKKLENAQAALAEETESLLILKEEKAALLDAVRTERRAAERLARELSEQARRLEREAGVVHGAGPQPDAVAGGFGAQQGHLPWPLPGQVVVPFGKRVDPVSSLVLFQKGIDVAASLGAPVRAVFAGRVVHAGALRGFGNVVVVDHGGWFTVYGHLGTLRLGEGTEVRQHEVLGFLGDGRQRRSVLYFEVRRGREPVDPQRWLTAG
ncbi:MAG: peptidoglycan DD-metalloendopeptidase family protein [Deltaproteobacteria bacterium]|nr:peptidoglycan DD-metalloendopeptidase family protein [Deltaproteobacteria bacterium]